jgi:Uma2 family endonuclease
MSILHHVTTAEELLRTPGLGRCELLRGELIMMSPAGFEHGRIAALICGRLVQFLEQHPVGVVMGAETGFWIERDPDTVRAPDVAFLRTERLPPTAVRGFFPEAPDLAVEVLSPDDRASEVFGKVQDWLAAGCRAVWVVDPASKTVSVYSGARQALVLREGDEITGGDLLSGFRLPLAEVFAWPRPGPRN